MRIQAVFVLLGLLLIPSVTHAEVGRARVGAEGADGPGQRWEDQKKDYQKRLESRIERNGKQLEGLRQDRKKADEELRSLAETRHELETDLAELKAARQPKDWESLRPRLDDTLRSFEKERPDWENEKDQYRKKLEMRLEQAESRIQELNGTLDGGDTKRRSDINEELHDLERERSDVKQKLDELKATTAVKWANVKNDIDDFFQDLKD